MIFYFLYSEVFFKQTWTYECLVLTHMKFLFSYINKDNLRAVILPLITTNRNIYLGMFKLWKNLEIK